MNETKMLSFEEWKELPVGHFATRDLMMEFLFDKARQGTIPADRAVEIPEEWPDDAMYISVQFRTAQDDFAGAAHEDIPRPVPAWIPVNRERCLLNIEGIAVEIIYSDAYTHLKRENMAQRDPAKIGKPWGEL